MKKHYWIVPGILYVVTGFLLIYSNNVVLLVNNSFFENNPGIYFESMLLYASMGIIFLAAVYYWMAPGFMLVWAICRPSRFTEWVVLSFPVAMAVHIGVNAVGKLLWGGIDRAGYLELSFWLGLLAWLLLVSQILSRKLLVWPLGSRQDIRRAITTILIPAVGMILLLPFIFWQDLNPDGLEALLVGKSLESSFLPLSTTGEPFSVGSGLIAQPYVFHSFMMFFGDVEASIRLPFLLFLPIVYCALIELVEWDGRRLKWPHEFILLLALTIFTVVVSFNASYDPYFADISAPAVEDIVVILCLLGAIYSLAVQRYFSLLGYALLLSFSRPTGILFLLMLMVALLVTAKNPLKRWALPLGLVIIVCFGFVFFYQAVIVPLMVTTPAEASGLSAALSRLRFLTLTDWQRIAYLIFPSGILPALVLVLYHKQDDFSRAITLVTIAYFAIFYFTAFVALHHFMPIMILPLVVFWRFYLDLVPTKQRVVYPLAAVGAVVALWMSLPTHFEVNRTARTIGSRTIFLIGDQTEPINIPTESEVLHDIIRYDWDVLDPSTEFVNAPGLVAYYADRSGPVRNDHNYIILPKDAPPPAGTQKSSEYAGAVLYIRDPDLAYRDRYQKLNVNYRSFLYAIPRETLFRHWGEHRKNYDVDLKSVVGFLGAS